MPKPKRYTRGCEDVERVMEHLSDEAKKERQREFLREHYSKKQKRKLPEIDNNKEVRP